LRVALGAEDLVEFVEGRVLQEEDVALAVAQALDEVGADRLGVVMITTATESALSANGAASGAARAGAARTRQAARRNAASRTARRAAETKPCLGMWIVLFSARGPSLSSLGSGAPASGATQG
jgi:hypothetical protein